MNVALDFAMDSGPGEGKNETASIRCDQTLWTHSSAEGETELLALSNMVPAIAMAVRNVCGEGSLLV